VVLVRSFLSRTKVKRLRNCPVPMSHSSQVMFRKKGKNGPSGLATAKMAALASLSLYLTYPSCRLQLSGKTLCQRRKPLTRQRDNFH
jgi:hypothetical protein